MSELVNKNMEIAVIGGGAAGFFSAISAKENYPESNITIFEKSSDVLAKVRVSGGGKCNVTNGCTSINELSRAYPRGEKFLRKIFQNFNTSHTMEWFEKRGVPLKIRKDNHVFPASNKSETIIDCFMNETEKLGIKIELSTGVKTIIPTGEKLKISFINEKLPTKIYDKIIVTTGGSPKREGLNWLEKLNHNIEDPVPSLFTFNMPSEKIIELMGVAVEETIVSIQGTKLKSFGPLLITHWGFSGPAILKLSAFGARILHEKNYNFTAKVNWVNISSTESVLNELTKIIAENFNKKISSVKPFNLSERLWNYLVTRSDLLPFKKWSEISKKRLNKLVNTLTSDLYEVEGKTTFKEEFVTCGGVSLQNIDHRTMQSKVCKNLYFAGEVLDIDGITGGYNFQAAWSTGFIAGKLL